MLAASRVCSPRTTQTTTPKRAAAKTATSPPTAASRRSAARWRSFATASAILRSNMVLKMPLATLPLSQRATRSPTRRIAKRRDTTCTCQIQIWVRWTPRRGTTRAAAWAWIPTRATRFSVRITRSRRSGSGFTSQVATTQTSIRAGTACCTCPSSPTARATPTQNKSATATPPKSTKTTIWTPQSLRPSKRR